LKRVDLPTFGSPTMPQRKPMICPWYGEARALGEREGEG
jgi:hypothetical protein